MGTKAFVVPKTSRTNNRVHISRTQNPPNMCICVDCKMVTKCKGYQVVENFHEVPHVAKLANFMPESPQIKVSLEKGEDGHLYREADLFACESFIEDKGAWARARP